MDKSDHRVKYITALLIVFILLVVYMTYKDTKNKNGNNIYISKYSDNIYPTIKYAIKKNDEVTRKKVMIACRNGAIRGTLMALCTGSDFTNIVISGLTFSLLNPLLTSIS